MRGAGRESRVRHIRRCRASVLLMVVACLALLAVMGTVYLLTARMERQTARMHAATVQLDLARDALLRQTQDLLLTSTLDSTGNVLSTPTSGTPARSYDYPETGVNALGQITFGQTLSGVADQPWLAGDLLTVDPLWNATTQYSAGDVRLYAGIRFVCLDTTGSNRGKRPDSAAGAVYWTPTTNGFSRLTAGLWDPSTGTVQTGSGENADQAGRWRYLASTPNASVVQPASRGVRDGVFSLLPLTSPGGVHYRAAVRIIDTNRLANLNTGNVDASLADAVGQYLSSYRLYFPMLCNEPSGTVQNLHAGTAPVGRGGGAVAFDYATWQTQILTLELPQNPPRSPVQFPSAVQLFDLSDELELRANGLQGTGGTCRPETLWPVTLAKSAAGRALFTAYSWDRNYRSMDDPGTSYPILTEKVYAYPSGVATMKTPPASIWPTFPRQVAINAKLESGAAGLERLASVAFNLFTILKALGYSDDQCRSMVVNYVAARYSGSLVQNPPTGFTGAWFIPFLDDSGLCIRDATGATYQFTGIPGTGKTYVGCAAQPFINEVAAVVTTDVLGNPIVSASLAMGVELYNPFEKTLDLSNWQLRVYDASGTLLGPVLTDLGGLLAAVSGQASTIAARGSTSPTPYDVYAVPVLDAFYTDSRCQHVPSLGMLLATGGGRVELLRPYHDWSGARQYVAVDRFDYGAVSKAKLRYNGSVGGALPALATLFASQQRWNTTPWQCDANDRPDIYEARQFLSVALGSPTLGVANTVSGTPTHRGIPLYDRFAVSAPPAAGAVFGNIGEFNRICRLAPRIDGSGASATHVPVTQQIAALAGNAAVTTEEFSGHAVEAAARFDFRWDPAARSFLNAVAMVDRASDPTVDVGWGATHVSKIRLPGRINVNTAPVAVLQAMHPCTDGSGADITAAVASNIVAYRDRTGAFPAGTYAGRGIRTLGELIIPVNAANSTAPTSLDDRDRNWAALATLGTVRSDTFALYGVIEALRANPNYRNGSAGHDNAKDWYASSLTDDESTASTTIPNIRLGQRRFVAILDRSYCNAPHSSQSFETPRIVALRELPD